MDRSCRLAGSLSPVSHKDEGRPVVWMAVLLGLLKRQRRLPESGALGHVLLRQVSVEALHQLGRALVVDAPLADHLRWSARDKQRPREADHPLPALIASLSAVAGREHDHFG